MIEKAVRFGPGQALVGVWTVPDPSKAGAKRPAVILLNGGIAPHTGTYRLHVRAARAFASHGFASLRFDFRGIGDSADPREALPLNDLIVQDMEAALSWVATVHDCDSVVMFGYCSGAFDALQAAERRREVRGIVSLDLNADFNTWQHHTRYLASRLVRLESLWNTLTLRNDRLRRITRRLGARRDRRIEVPQDRPPITARRPFTREEAHDRLSATLEREVELLCVFSGGLPHLYNYERQFADALPDIAAHPRIRVLYLPDANHSFRGRAQQEDLMTHVLRWMQQRFEVL